MPTVRFLGRVFPQLGLGLNESPQFGMVYREIDLHVSATVHIKKSEVEVVCELSRYDPTYFGLLHLHILHQTRACVDLVAFSTGKGLTTILEFFVDPDGVRIAILSQDENIKGFCTVSIPDIMGDVLNTFDVSTVLNMLTSTLERPYGIPVNCARAIEAMGHLITPGEKHRKKRWQQLHLQLQLTCGYLNFITDLSTGPRHGELVQPPGPDQIEARNRAWTVMSRFLEFRRRGGVEQLPSSEFPLLD